MFAFSPVPSRFQYPLKRDRNVGNYPVIGSQLVDGFSIYLVPKLLANELHHV